MELRIPKVGAMKAYHDRKRSEMSDRELLDSFKCIRYQCKWGKRCDTTLCEYIGELEYRGIKYRL